MNSNPVKVLVVDDSALVREVISTGLAQDPDIEVVGSPGQVRDFGGRAGDRGFDQLLDVLGAQHLGSRKCRRERRPTRARPGGVGAGESQVKVARRSDDVMGASRTGGVRWIPEVGVW